MADFLRRPPGRTLVMGVLNVTPDSFSDGGRYADVDAAVRHGLQMRSAGADLVDVGGESTRPGAERVDAGEETRRILPVVTELAAAGVPVSIDTTRAVVAERALAAGAVLVNDVSGGRADAGMPAVVCAASVPWVLMHSRGHSRDMHLLSAYDDVVAEVRDELCKRVDAALVAGVEAGQLVLDPGLGFAKRPEHNWQLLHRLDRLQDLGFPLLVGASRKAFLGRLLAGADGVVREAGDRDDATTAVSALAAAAGVWGVRVHDVRASVDAVRVAAAWRTGTS
ncbi:MAG: dihydropteroate synthase [Geodermatophilaceae bacterium]